MRQIGLYIFFAFSLTFFNASNGTLVPYRKADKWGYSNSAREIKISCIYDRTFPFRNGLGVVYQKNKGYGLIDESGKEITALKYSELTILDDGMVRFMLNNKFGFLDHSGKEIIPAKYDNGYGYSPEFFNGVVRLNLDGKWGGIDKSGKEVVPFIYDDLSDFSEGIAVTRTDDRFGFIDTTGAIFLGQNFNNASNFSEGLAFVETSDYKKIFINRKGEKAFDAEFLSAGGFKNGFCKVGVSVGLDMAYGLIDSKGAMVIQPLYPNIGDFSDGLARFYKNNKVGFIDERGKIIIPEKFEQFDEFSYKFSEGLCPVLLNGKWGVIDSKGKMVVPPKYDAIGNFKEGLASFALNSAVGFIDSKGNEVIPAIYLLEEYAMPEFENGFARVRLKSGYNFSGEGYIDRNGVTYFE
jgi:hypothetical protein